jgi:integrase/recombinase XerC
MKKAESVARTAARLFFYLWLVEQRNASDHTVRSYRDTWRLLLRFVTQRHQRTVAQPRLGDLTAS